MLDARVLKHFHRGKRSSAEILLCLQALRAWAASATPLFVIRGTPGWQLGGKPVPASSGALCGSPASALSPAIHRAQFENHWFSAIIE